MTDRLLLTLQRPVEELTSKVLVLGSVVVCLIVNLISLVS